MGTSMKTTTTTDSKKSRCQILSVNLDESMFKAVVADSKLNNVSVSSWVADAISVHINSESNKSANIFRPVKNRQLRVFVTKDTIAKLDAISEKRGAKAGIIREAITASL